jgi:hypothetical protein
MANQDWGTFDFWLSDRIAPTVGIPRINGVGDFERWLSDRSGFEFYAQKPEIYYVRKSGSDGNSGSSVQDAWLTIDNAANNVAAGDTVYVGAGVYRELVTMDTSGSSGNQIQYIADVDGEQTGDAGLVIISAYADEDSAASRASCVNMNSKTFITWRGFVMDGGTTGAISSANATDDTFEGVIIEDCVIMSGHDDLDYGIFLDFNSASTPTNNGPTIRGCTLFGGGIQLQWDQHDTAQQNLKITVENCVIWGNQGTNTNRNSGVHFNHQLTGTHGLGGVSVNNCTISMYYGVSVDHNTSTTYPVDVRNCVIYAATGLSKGTSNDGALTSNYNTIFANADYSNVTSGGNDRTNSNRGPVLFGGGKADFPLWRFLGWSPYKPWEPIRLQDDSYSAHIIGDANTADAPATDILGNSRPMQGTVDDRGAVEGRARPEEETTTVNLGSSSIRFEGAGYHDFLVAVDAASTTISVKARYDSNYTGTLPQLQVLNIPGVADQTDTMVAAANTWEDLSVNFTPGSAGIARVRLLSNDTSATGESFFDVLAIS